jgi:hypothetical protein
VIADGGYESQKLARCLSKDYPEVNFSNTL